MATVVLGVVGAAVGSAFGNPQLGWSIGTLLGGLWDRPRVKAQDRGKLSDVPLTGSAFGAAIPQVYGQALVGGNIIWATDLDEHSKETRVGGKGGGRQTVREYSYTVSFMFLVSASEEGNNIRRIWFDDLLVYDTTQTPATQFKIRVYLGPEDQNPDPLYQGVLGVGKVPAYRDRITVVVEDYPLDEHGNRVPTIQVELACAGSGDVVEDTADLLVLYEFEVDPGFLKDSGPGHYDLTVGFLANADPGEPIKGAQSALVSTLEAQQSTVVSSGPFDNRMAGFRGSNVASELSVEAWVKFINPIEGGGGLVSFGLYDPVSIPSIAIWQLEAYGLVAEYEWLFGKIALNIHEIVNYSPYSINRTVASSRVDFDGRQIVGARLPKHVAFTFKGKKGSENGRFRLYFNGRLATEVVNNTHEIFHLTTNDYFAVKHASPNTFLVDNIAVYNRELNQNEIQKHMG